MSRIDELTDQDIEELIRLPKIVREDKFRRIKIIDKNGYKRFNLEVESQNTDVKFEIFCRQAIDDPTDYSVGLVSTFQDGSNIRLMRCNGLHGTHRNNIEKTKLTGKHIHVATERYIRKGFDAEGVAVSVDNDYDNVESAFDCLIDKCNITVEGANLFNL